MIAGSRRPRGPKRLLFSTVCLLLGITGVSCSAIGAPLTWIWSNPQPHGNEIYDFATSGALSVEVGERGQLYTSLNQELWVPRVSGTDRALRAVVFFGNNVVITGEEGTVVSADVAALTDFTFLDLGTTDWLEGVAASTNQLVAVGDNGAIYTSEDAQKWTRRPVSFSLWLRGVAYGQGTFVTVGEGGLIATSPDGVAWQVRPSQTFLNLNRVAWLTNHFVLVGDSGTVLVSTDASGSRWNPVSKSNSPTNDLYGVAGSIPGLVANGTILVTGDNELRLLQGGQTAWSNQLSVAGSPGPAPAWTYYTAWDAGGNYFVAGHTGQIVEGFQTNTSAAYEWATPPASVRNWLWDVTHLAGIYLAAGDFGTIMTSPDGATWDVGLVSGAATNSVLLGVGGRTNLMLAVGSAGQLLTSTNAVVWSSIQPSPTTNDLQGILCFSNLFTVCGGNGSILTSPDSLAWTAHPTHTTSFLSGIASFPGGLVVVGDAGAILTSPDEVTWTLQASGLTNWIYRVRYLADQLVAVGEAGLVLTSPDGSKWTRRDSGTTQWLDDVVLLDGTYYAFGAQGTGISSPDGAVWAHVAVITQSSLFSAVAAQHQLVVVGTEGVILRGQPAPLNILGYARTQGTNLFRISGVPGSQLTLQRTEDLLSWTNLAQLQLLDNTGVGIVQDARTNPPPRETYRAAQP